MDVQRRRRNPDELLLPLGGTATRYRGRGTTQRIALVLLCVFAGMMVVLGAAAVLGRRTEGLATDADAGADAGTDAVTTTSVHAHTRKEKDRRDPVVITNLALAELQDDGDDDPYEDETTAARRAAVRAAFNFSLSHYIARALGADEVRPVSGTAFNDLNYACTLTDAMSSALVMGLDAEYRVLRDHVVSARFDPFNRGKVSVFETTIRVLGGLASAHALTGGTDAALLARALDVFESLAPAFATRSGVPEPWVHIEHGRVRAAGHGTTSLAECGTLQLELAYLTAATGDTRYRETGLRVVRTLVAHNPRRDGLFPDTVAVRTGTLAGAVHVGARADSFYEYLVKMHALYRHAHRGTDQGIAAHYARLAGAALPSLLRLERRSARGHAFLSDEHLGCFVGGMFALAARTLEDTDAATRDTYLRAAERYTEGCYMAYATSPTGLAADTFALNDPAGNLAATGRAFILRPEAIESIFYLWRVTHNPRYREWGWTMFQAIERSLRREYGYTGLHNAQDLATQNDHQQSWFLGETLKYFYLLFSSDNLIPLDRYVFNTEAHPLPIIT